VAHLNRDNLRSHILDEIRRIAGANGGTAPGQKLFAKTTGISDHKWRGVYWARWGDAIVEAGFAQNKWQGRHAENFLFEQMILAVRHYRRFPTVPELNLFRATHHGFPEGNTYRKNFGSTANAISAFRQWLSGKSEYADIPKMLPEQSAKVSVTNFKTKAVTGYVYLLASGGFYKIGRSDNVERRIKEITIALPEKVAMVHAIGTDDPAGIEAYWHKRYADRRANGEWFKLNPDDIAVFKRRKYQ
jgi:Meiotically up-regulated gene 113